MHYLPLSADPAPAATRRAKSGLLGTFWLLVCVGLTGPLVAGEIKEIGPGQPGPHGRGPSATGGPDVFGYTFADQSNESCSYQLLDISSTGTLIDWGFGGSDDNSSGAVSLGAAFDFYGTDYTELNISTNGYLSTDPDDLGTSLGSGDPPSMCPLPSALLTGGGARIYPLLDDLVSNTAYVQYFSRCPRSSDRCRANEDCTVFMWKDTHHFGDSLNTFDLEAVLYHQTDDLVLTIGDGNPELGAASTTGIQSAPATAGPPYPTSVPESGLTYACDTASSIANETAVCYFHPNEIPDPCVFSDLVLSKSSDAADRVEPGTEVTFTLTLSNDGPDDARGTRVSDVLDEDLSYVSDDCGAGAPATDTWIWTVDNLPADSLVACNLVVEVVGPRGNSVDNTATVSLDNFDPDESNNSSDTVSFDIGFLSDLSMAKSSDAPERPEVGAVVVYTLGATNDGPDPSVNAVVTDELPDQVAYQSNDCGAPDAVGQLFTWTPGTIASGGTAECNVTVSVLGPVGETVENSAEVAVDNLEPDLSNNQSEVVSFTVGPISDLNLEQVSSFAGQVDLPVLFTLTASNLGPDSTEGVQVVHKLAEQLMYQGDDCGVGAPVDGVWTWDIGFLDSGTDAQCVVTTTVITGGFNLPTSDASVSGDNFDPDLDNNSDAVTFLLNTDGLIFIDGFESGEVDGWS